MIVGFLIWIYLKLCFREVFARFELSAGCYVIVPATFNTGDSSNFMIRVYSENKIDLESLWSVDRKKFISVCDNYD